ncbi:MAG: hypothetical protein FD134_1054 [Gallionellaceae bacterium]|nr:MAG: hypothetical protein FD134_1054 [Gallionellaceae bacterium]
MMEPKAKKVAKKVAVKSAVTVEGKTATAGAKKTAAVKKSAAAKKTATRKSDCESCHGQTGKAAVDHAACAKTASSPAKRKAVVGQAAGASTKAVAAHQGVAKPNHETLNRMIEVAAYFIAEQQDFQGHSHDHWLAAEREVAAKLGLGC